MKTATLMQTALRFPAAAVALVLGAALAPVAHADFFGVGESRFEIPFVTVGQPGNPADTTGAPNPAGSVGYTYRIGKYEVPEEAVRKANAASALAGAPLDITLDERGPQKPATRLSWFEAARFVNWLNADKGHAPAYKFSGAGEFGLWQAGDAGYNSANPFRSTQARYFLPGIDEWYKAAFYDPAAGVYWDYPTGSNDAPIPVASGNAPGTSVWNQVDGPADVRLAGGESPYKTVGQGGNVQEWHESYSGVLTAETIGLRAIRGSDWFMSPSAGAQWSLSDPSDVPARLAFAPVGFRLASVPEPTAACTYLLALSLVCSSIRTSQNR